MEWDKLILATLLMGSPTWILFYSDSILMKILSIAIVHIILLVAFGALLEMGFDKYKIKKLISKEKQVSGDK